ncbi:MAG: M67 family metallopeptidase [Candidatus Korobacteraceae bacterium]
MLKFKLSDYDEIRRHGEETYPHECCGILLGTADGTVRTVLTAIRCSNTRTDSPHNRYHIDPRELLRAQREAHERGIDIVGFYHSHPDHPPRWSQTDFNEAHWIGCSYVITSVEQGRAAVTNSFALAGSTEEDKALVDEEVVVEG